MNKEVPVDQDVPKEHRFKCPNCVKETSMELDMTRQEEDVETEEECEVCGNVIEVHYRLNDGKLVFFEASDLEQE